MKNFFYISLPKSILITLLLLSFFFEVKGNDLISLNEKNLLEVMSHVDYLEDKSNSLDLNSVKSLNFKKNYSGSINFGLSNSTYWFRLKIKNPTSSPIENWFFFIEYPQLDEVVFYIPMKNDSYFEKSIGDIYPFQDRDMKIRFLNLRLPNGFKEGEDVFIKVKSVPAITIPLFVGTEIAFRNKDHVRQMSIGSYIGILFIMALYNLFLFIILREAAYIYYVLFVLSVCLYVISFLGLGYEFIWSNYPYLQSHMILISSCVMLFNLCLFTISFFDTKTYAPKIHIYLIYSLVIFPLTIIFILISNSILKVYLTSTLGIIYSFLLPLIGFYVWKKGNRFARVYLFAWIPFFMAANLFILKTFGIIDKYALEINYLVQFANIFEAVVFSFALADRVRVLQKENEIAQLEMLDTMKKDIDSFRLLQAANKLANTDSLTGLHNRRYFYTLVETLWRKPDPLIPDMSMLVIDVDHFKKVNDTYGHDVGDQVLKQVAEILSKSIRNMDIVGRYGGEEFLVFLPKTNIQEAIELAEKIRVSIQEQKILLSENQILQITASIGVASRVEKEMEIDQLVKSADTMLYKAKESGRNRVVGFS